MWLKNTEGKKDAMLTFAAIGFVVATLNIILGSLGTITIGSLSFDPKFLSSDLMAVYLGSTFTSYCMRKYTDKKFSPQDILEGVKTKFKPEKEEREEREPDIE